MNYYLNENLARMFFGIYMITVADPQILWNDGFYPLVDVTIPEGSYWKPRHPAALGSGSGIAAAVDGSTAKTTTAALSGPANAGDDWVIVLDGSDRKYTVVSGNIEGKTQTATLRVQDAYENYNQSGAYGISLVLAAMSVVVLVAMTLLKPKEGTA